MVGIPMDRMGAGMLECGCYCTANGIAFRAGCNRDGCSGTLMLLSSRLIVGMVWYSFPRALGVKFPVWITDNGVVGVGYSFTP